MPLSAGARLGPYEIIGPLGSGGMGEVYGAKDTRLDRKVAIKILAQQLSENSRLQQRFDREARALASLSHPHICTLHDVGRENGVDFLVMEYLEGETLAARLERGPLPLEQVLRLGTQMAEALDRAHRLGVVHRDLKPGNIMLTRTGAKLLDFGLAKVATSAMETTHTQPSIAPTEACHPLTIRGTIVGTLDYMAPEQVEGEEADARSDIFALGAVLYEMVTGRRAFSGKSHASVISAILSSNPPPLSEVQPGMPPALDRAIHRCLAKDPDERWQSARDLMLELRWIADAGSKLEHLPQGSINRRKRIAWITGLAGLTAALGLAIMSFHRPTREMPAARFAVSLPEGTVASLTRISPDGTHFSFTIVSDVQAGIWIRPLDELAARPLPGTEGARAHFWSPDSRSIGFFARGKLRKISLSGGPPQDICDAPGAGPFQSGAWGGGGSILFHVAEAPGHQEGLFRVSEAGGEPTRVTVVDESEKELVASWPVFLPDGRHFVFPAARWKEDGGLEPGGTYVASLESSKAHKLLDATSYAVYEPAGYLLYIQGGTLFARPFDSDALRFRGEPLRIADQLTLWAGIGAPFFAVSENGVLVFETHGEQSRLAWKGREGAEIGQAGPPADYGAIRISPEGRRIAAMIANPQTGLNDIGIIDITRNVTTRFTPEDSDAYYPVWSPDGSRMVYCRPEKGPPFLHEKPLAGGEEEELLPPSGTMQCPTDWSADGRFILYQDRVTATNWDIWILPLDGNRRPIPFQATRHEEKDATFSPDVRWVAYASDETGRPEIYVQPFQGPGERQRVSRAGGTLPRWGRDGKGLFYLGAAGQLMAVPVALGPNLALGAPAAQFTGAAPGGLVTEYDVSPDGERFLVNVTIPGAGAAPTVLLNWTTRLAGK